MDDLHVSMASGGAYLLLYSGFWEKIDAVASGKQFRAEVHSLSGSSAGAVIGSAVAMGVPGRAIKRSVLSHSLSNRFYYLRALAVYLGLKKSMYDSQPFYRTLVGLCSNRTQRLVPITIAVTDRQFQQHSVSFDAGDTGMLNAAVASASIPYVFAPRMVAKLGMCVDGSLNKFAFPREEVVRRLQTQSGRLVLLNCVPWPGFRGDDHVQRKQSMLTRLLTSYDQDLYRHGMESIIDNVVSPRVAYQDGIFDFYVDNRQGVPRRSSQGNLHVIMVAPTHSQYVYCGGAASKAKLSFKKTDKFVPRIQDVGSQMATEFLTRFGNITW